MGGLLLTAGHQAPFALLLHSSTIRFQVAILPSICSTRFQLEIQRLNLELFCTSGEACALHAKRAYIQFHAQDLGELYHSE